VVAEKKKKRIIVGGWFDLPRLGTDVFGALVRKNGVAYDKSTGFKFDSGTDMQAAVGTLLSAGVEVELVLRCYICVPGGTVIIGDNKQIRNLRTMDQSVGISGLGDIHKTFSRSYEGKLIKIRATGLLPLELTPEHPVLVSRSLTTRHRKGKSRTQKRGFSKLHWKEAASVVPKKEGNDGDYLFVPRVPGSFTQTALPLHEFTTANGRRVCVARRFPLEIPLNTETAWLLGIYIAEGFPASSSACFSLNHDEEDLQRRIIDVGESMGYSPKKYRAPTSTVVIIPSRIIARAFSTWCGRGAKNKRVPDFVLFHKNLALLKALLEGYTEGDGYKAGDISRMSSTSKVLALQLQLLAARLGLFLSVSKVKSDPGLIDGRPIRGGSDKYIMESRPRSNQSFAKVTNLGILAPVREVETSTFKGQVYNLETTDNTYLVSNAVVHNCGKEACPGCPYLSSCDRTRVSTFCLCGDHAPEKSVFGAYTKTFDVNLKG
jgi:intein/homing endonuclease